MLNLKLYLFRFLSYIGTIRIYIPFIFDALFVFNPELIKEIDIHPDVDRLNRIESKNVPSWLKLFLRASRFYDEVADKYFLSLCAKSDPSFEPRLKEVNKSIDDMYTKRDVREIVNFLMDSDVNNIDDVKLGYLIVKLFGDKFTHKHCSMENIEIFQRVYSNITEMINVSKYFPAVESARSLFNFVNHDVDMGHDLVTLCIPTVKTIKLIAQHPDMDPEFLATSNPTTFTTVRCAIRDTNLSGRLYFKIRERSTIIVHVFAVASILTNDYKFFFGHGVQERICPFSRMLPPLLNDIRKGLNEFKNE